MDALPVHGFIRDITVYSRGTIIGFVMAAPIGPVNVLCMQRTLQAGRISGIISGLGAASADAFYAGIAGFGLTLISHLLTRYSFWFRVIGGLFIFYLGLRAMFRGISAYRPAPAGKGSFSSFSSTLLLTLTNPTTVFSYGLMFAAFGVPDVPHDTVTATFLVLGVFTGSSLWWIVLSTVVGKLRTNLGDSGLRRIARISGLIITGFGIFVLTGALRV